MIRSAQPTEAQRKFIDVLTTEFTTRCAFYVELLKSKGIDHQQACSLVGSSMMSAAAGSMQATAAGLGIPYTEADHGKLCEQLQAIMQAEDERLRNLYTGASN